MERLNSRASMETLVSLQELDPSPIDTPDLYKDLPDLPDESPSSSPPAGTLGLSGLSNGHGAVYYLTRLQKYSSYTFSLFTALHLANTSLFPLLTRSIPSSDSLLLLTRPYYQSPLLEPLLILTPLAIHILAGLSLRLHRRNATLRRYGFSHLSPLARARRGLRIWPGLNWTQATGFALVAFLGCHAYVNRILPLIHEGSSSGVGLAFAAHGFARHPVLAWGAHVALLGAAAGHMVWGWARWLGYLVPVDKEREEKRRWTINGVVAAVAGLWAAGGLGVVARGGAATGWVAKGFDELYSKIPVLGVYM